jgi:Subtilase family
LLALGQGVNANMVRRQTSAELPMLTVRLERTALPPRVQLTPAPEGRVRELAAFDASRERHARLIGFLERHPQVRNIELPGVISRSAPQPRVRPGTVAVPERNSERTWPKIGVIDGGISDAALGSWVIGRWDLLADDDVDPAHGTFIGGILVAGSQLNGPDVCSDKDGAELYDIAVFPSSDTAFATYHGDLVGFLNEVENAIVEARTRHQVRIFNFSLNVQNAVVPDHYSKVAARLDQIADEHDVIIFISAGNLTPPRPEWPNKPDIALQMLAASQNDGILVPAESARNVSVGALNPHGLGTSIGNAPARYSRRGPGLKALVKPDFAFVGGSGSPTHDGGHGLFSVAPDGNCADGCGTSYAAPFLARQAAILDAEIEGGVSRETLMALLTHYAEVPAPLSDPMLNVVGRQLCGHGMPICANDMLDSDDHQITLVFASRLQRDKQMRFNFSWPSCLVDASGKCRGAAKLTLVASPPLNQRFGAAFVRINVEAALQQEQISRRGKVNWKGQLKPLYLPLSNLEHPYEAERVEHGMKWSPVKVCGTTMPQGRGSSTNWRPLVPAFQGR